ncbi:MAG TPA: ATP-grasp domain-containing protein [Pirellulales bacterium]|nr:ATP-grasp domain-containing protein [Pirellulales bacterium]
MPTLLLSRTCPPETSELAAVARRARWNIQWLGRRHGPAHLHGDELALYAPTDVALRVSRLHQLALIEPMLGILAGLPERYTSRQVNLMTLGEAELLDDRAFIKPADCTAKVFDAAVYECGSRILRDDDLSLDTPVLVSEPVEWENEYRTVVLERHVIAFSPYIRGGWLARDAQGKCPCPAEESEGMLAFCRQLLADERIDLPPAFVLDMGTITGRGWAVVELNPVWCSGLLGCNLQAVLPALRRACRRPSELSPEDRRWLVAR